MFDTKTPSAAQMVEDARLKARLAELGRRQQETAERLNDQQLTDEQIEAERFQYECNALAEEHPLYAAARAASANFLVVPLEPQSTSPLVDPKVATNDARLLLKWWQEWPEANPGILLGRIGGVLALRVEDEAAALRLRQMAAVEMLDVDTDRGWVEHRDIGGERVRLHAPSQSFSMRAIQGWGKAYTRALVEREQRLRAAQPQTFFIVYSYPSVVSGIDAFNYRSKTVLPGVKLMGEGEVLAWQGSILDGGIQVVAPMGKPPEIPTWLASSIGKPRSRREMAAAREAYEAIQRRDNAHVIARIAATRAFEDEARAKAEEDRQRAEAILADAMKG
jgi:hypothetical protein